MCSQILCVHAPSSWHGQSATDPKMKIHDSAINIFCGYRCLFYKEYSTEDVGQWKYNLVYIYPC